MQSKTPKATVKTIISEIPKSPSKNWGEELPEEVHQQLQENKEEPTHPEYVNHFPSLGDTPPDKKTAYLSPPNKKGSDFIREILSPSNANQKETQAQVNHPRISFLSLRVSEIKFNNTWIHLVASNILENNF